MLENIFSITPVYLMIQIAFKISNTVEVHVYIIYIN